MGACHFRVITPDSRGHGRTVNPARELSYSTMADDLAAFIQALGLEKPFIFGYSDGGQTALDFGMRYPDLAKALVIGAAWYRFSEEYQNALKNAGYEGPGLLNFEVIGKKTPPDWLSVYGWRIPILIPHITEHFWKEFQPCGGHLWIMGMRISKGLSLQL